VSKIQDALTDLRRSPGIKGSALVTSDGLIIAQSLDAQFRDDVVAGLTSFLLMTTSRCLQDCGMGGFSHFFLHATHGKVVFLELDSSYLVVLCDQFADLEGCRNEINGAAQQLRRAARMS
jgi:uncharacterized protein